MIARKLAWIVFLILAHMLSNIASAAVPEKIVFGGASGFPPMEWNEGGRATGFNVDLAKEMAAQGGKTLTYQVGSWPEVIRGLDAGMIDAVPMFKSPEREQIYLFTEAFYYLHHGIYSAEGSPPARTLDALRGKRVAVEANSVAEAYLRTEVPDAIAVVANTTVEVLRAVNEDNDADYGIATTLSADRAIDELGLRVEQTSKPLWPVGYAFATRRDRPEVASWLQTSLAQVNVSGRYQQIYDVWKPDLVPLRSQQIALQYLQFAIAGTVAALLLVFFWQMSLRRTVELKTRALKQALAQQAIAEVKLKQIANIDSDTGVSRPGHFIEKVDAHLSAVANPRAAEKEMIVVKLMGLDDAVRVFGFEHARRAVLTLVDVLKELPQHEISDLGRGVFAVFREKGDGREYIKALRDKLVEASKGGTIRPIGGSAYWSDRELDATRLLNLADTALSAGLKRKRDWIAYSADMEPARRDLDIRSDFASGAAAQISPVFQPILDLKSGTIESAEILARWKHPTHGDLSPSLFVPILEKSGLSFRLAERMISEAIRVGSALSARGLECTINVNINAQDLVDEALISTIEERLKEHDGVAGRLRLELTETNVTTDPALARESFERLQAMGVLATVDDFGTGYSSLSYLTMFPIHELKIDRGFVTDMLRNSRHRSIVCSTIAMAKELGILIVAEGVEDRATLYTLQADGCDRAQGYCISLPLVEDAFMAYMLEHGSKGAPPTV